MTRRNLRESLAKPDLAVGGWLVEKSPSALNGYATAGYDYVGIDCQHSFVDARDVAEILSHPVPSDVPIIVRTSSLDSAEIGRVLDAGADAVIVPGIDTRDEAAKAVAACRYPPRGTRSFGPLNPRLGHDPIDVENHALRLLMIETRAGLDNAESICSTEGVDGIYIGPADLSIGLGLPPLAAFASDQLLPALERVRLACSDNDLLLGAHAVDAESALRWKDLGIDFVSIGSNVGAFIQAARATLSDIRQQRDLTTSSNLYT
ncbi:HpcH/HpaI aldolase family protein [Rhodococcus koreensis]